MTELEDMIYQHFQTHAQYNFSTDLSVKSSEIRAIKALEDNNCIVIKANAIGYVIAEVL